MTRMIAGLALLDRAAAAATGADGPVKFAGEWKSTSGPVVFEQKGDEVSGKIVFWNLPLKGKVEEKGRKLAVSYIENQAKVNATLEFDESGNAFAGPTRPANGNQWDLERLAARPLGRHRAKPGRLRGALAHRPRPDGAEPRRRQGQGPVRAPGDVQPRGDGQGAAPRIQLKALPAPAPAGSTSTRRARPSPAPAGPTATPLVRLEGPQGPRVRPARPARRRQDRRRLDREPPDLHRPRPRGLQGRATARSGPSSWSSTART